MRSPLSISVRPTRVLAVLSGIIVVLLGFSLIGQFSSHVLGHGRLLGFVHGFNVDGEGNVPAHFSTLLLLSVSVLTGLIAMQVRRTEGLYGRHWLGLAFIFAFLAVDELNSFHERLMEPTRTLLGTDGLLYFAWVIPGMAMVAVFVGMYARFFWHLPARWKRLFAGAGVLYVGGAIGCELLAGAYFSQHGLTFTYAMLATAEEALEMVGMAVFLYALLDYLRARTGTMRVSFVGGVPEAAGSHP